MAAESTFEGGAAWRAGTFCVLIWVVRKGTDAFCSVLSLSFTKYSPSPHPQKQRSEEEDGGQGWALIELGLSRTKSFILSGLHPLRRCPGSTPVSGTVLGPAEAEKK